MTDMVCSQNMLFFMEFYGNRNARLHHPKTRKIPREYRANMRRMQRKNLELLLSERDRWVLWAPVFFGMGIGAYFALLNEPSHASVAIAACASVLIAIGTILRRWSIWPIFAVIALFMAGGYAAVLRTESVAAPILQKEDAFAVAEGKVVEIVPRETNTRLLLSDVRLEGYPSVDNPAKVSVTLKGTSHMDAVKQGDVVRVKAGFFPP
ncbi:MAG: DUF4131 domain-containing protein, partial [Alphaproteobacteria bacterium]|nr:DUF4131 domain-containing protein [Alphaproteobacteria bacterium]